MAPEVTTPRRPAGTRIRTRPKSVGGVAQDKQTPSSVASEPPRKKGRYIPGGPGGGGRYVDPDGNEIPVGGTGPGGYNYIGPRGRIGRENLANGVVPPVYKRRERDRRNQAPRTVQPRQPPPVMRYSSAAQVAAVVQSDGYKPREERAWEEFHPDLDIDACLLALSANEIAGIEESRPVTPIAQSVNGSVNGIRTPSRAEGSKSEGNLTPIGSVNGEFTHSSIPGTPGGSRRRPGRPPKNPSVFWAKKAKEAGLVANTGIQITGRIMAPISNFHAKEKLTLPQPSYRKTDTLARFEDKSLSFVRYVDKSMAKVGYQESDNYERPEFTLIKGADLNLEEDLDLGPGNKSDGDGIQALGTTSVGRVEYDMDEQDDKWLEAYNKDRVSAGHEPITREIFEITITKIEKEWHALEKRIPKPNPKPPQTHRPRSSSAAAVNGEVPGEEQDSKCAICDEGDCENTNAIVFCDGCDLAVHQECYGVPFIPEGQWLCRKCQLIGRGIPTCIFCPNTDGAFKQTNSSKWAHLLCAMWIPEVNVGNTTFMEPVMDVEKVPKPRWKLSCYLCNQRMGACIQCGNKACYQAFHVTCARRARLYLKMKNSQGTLAIIDGSTVQKAFCDKHCPPEHARENDVAHATMETKKFYKKTMRGQQWAPSTEAAITMAASHRHAVTEHQPDESQLTGQMLSSDAVKKGNQPQKAMWRLPSGAPVIPKYVFEIVEKSLAKFSIHKRKEYAANACQYWTLKREARRGAALLKRLQLQMETFSSMEMTRRNFSGPAGDLKLQRRIEFAKLLVAQLESIQEISNLIVEREAQKLEAALLEESMVDEVYFPVAKLIQPVMDKAVVLDKGTFATALLKVKEKVNIRKYVEATPFLVDFCGAFQSVIEREVMLSTENESSKDDMSLSMKKIKSHGKKILNAIQSMLEELVKADAEFDPKDLPLALGNVARLMNSCLEWQIDVIASNNAPVDTEMQISDDLAKEEAKNGDITMEDATPLAIEENEDSIEVATGEVEETINTDIHEKDEHDEVDRSAKGKQINGTKSAPTPPEDGYTSTTEELPDTKPTPPTPPISNGGISSDSISSLSDGRFSSVAQTFQPEGTSIIRPSPLTPFLDDLSDVEGALEFDAEEAVAIAAVSASPAKAKKAKAKKKARRR